MLHYNILSSSLVIPATRYDSATARREAGIQFFCHCEERSDEAISCRSMRLPRSLRSLAMTIQKKLHYNMLSPRLIQEGAEGVFFFLFKSKCKKLYYNVLHYNMLFWRDAMNRVPTCNLVIS